MTQPEGPRIGRRQIMAASLLYLTGIAPGLQLHRRASAREISWPQHLFSDVQAAAALGRQYVAAVPGEGSEIYLARALFGSDPPAAVGRGSLVQLGQRIRANRARDFRSGDLVALEGWLVTRTEARLMALVALTSAR